MDPQPAAGMLTIEKNKEAEIESVFICNLFGADVFSSSTEEQISLKTKRFAAGA
jgi:hypothetical protein